MKMISNLLTAKPTLDSSLVKLSTADYKIAVNPAEGGEWSSAVYHTGTDELFFSFISKVETMSEIVRGIQDAFYSVPDVKTWSYVCKRELAEEIAAAYSTAFLVDVS
jgi:hypothetical protein